MAANISLHPLGERVSRSNARTARVLSYAEDEGEDDDGDYEEKEERPARQLPRPPRVSNVRQKHRHTPSDQFYTPIGAVTALLRVIGVGIYRIYTGSYI
jgi:hypothetical protein